MKISLFFIPVLFLASRYSYSGTLSESALKFVPGGSVVQERSKEVKVKTSGGSVVEIEFETDGTFEEASGQNPDADVFEPGNALWKLSDIVASLKKQGLAPTGEWTYEKSFIRGWHYELEGFENGKKMDYIVDAKNGKILESKVDD